MSKKPRMLSIDVLRLDMASFNISFAMVDLAWTRTDHHMNDIAEVIHRLKRANRNILSALRKLNRIKKASR